MKLSRATRPSSRADRSVAWWSTLLLLALGAVLTALFLSARLLLSLANEPGIEQTSVRATSLAYATSVLQSRDDRTVRSHGRSTL
jgi:hypothetical protein